MRGRPKAELVLSEADNDQLSALTLRRKTSQALALRARIILTLPQGFASTCICDNCNRQI